MRLLYLCMSITESKSLLIFSASFGILFCFVQTLQPEPYITWQAWVALGYFIVLTWITFNITRSAMSKDNKTFFLRVYSAIGIRFVFSLGPLVIYLAFVKEKSIPLVLVYALIYLSFTAFEAITTFRAQKKLST